MSGLPSSGIVFREVTGRPFCLVSSYRTGRVRLELPAAVVPITAFRRWKCSQTRPTEPRIRQIQRKFESLDSLLPEAISSSQGCDSIPASMLVFHYLSMKAAQTIDSSGQIISWGVCLLKEHVWRESNRGLRCGEDLERGLRSFWPEKVGRPRKSLSWKQTVGWWGNTTHLVGV